MKKLINSIYAFGAYILGTGLVLMFLPQALFTALQLADTPNIWVKLLGLALTALGVYYIKAARDSNLEFIKGTITVRIGQFAIVGMLLVQNDGPYILLVISAVELCFGIWSLLLLNKLNKEGHNKNT